MTSHQLHTQTSSSNLPVSAYLQSQFGDYWRMSKGLWHSRALSWVWVWTGNRLNCKILRTSIPNRLQPPPGVPPPEKLNFLLPHPSHHQHLFPADDFSFSPTAFPSFLFSLCSNNLLLPIYFPMNDHSLTKQGKAVVSKISCQGMLYDTIVAKQLPPSSPPATSSYLWNHPLRTRRTCSRIRCLNRASRNWSWNFVIRADTRVQRGAAQLHLPLTSPVWKVLCMPQYWPQCYHKTNHNHHNKILQ